MERPIDRWDRVVHELVGVMKAFADSQSMKALAETEPDFDWWYTRITKQLAKIDQARDDAIRKATEGE